MIVWLAVSVPNFQSRVMSEVRVGLGGIRVGVSGDAYERVGWGSVEEPGSQLVVKLVDYADSSDSV